MKFYLTKPEGSGFKSQLLLSISGVAWTYMDVGEGRSISEVPIFVTTHRDSDDEWWQILRSDKIFKSM